MPSIVDGKLAHIRKIGNSQEDQSLASHLEGVASLAKNFASPFGGSAVGEALGQMHDLGKIYDIFQDRLAGKTKKRFSHAMLGTLLAWAAVNGEGWLGKFQTADDLSLLVNGKKCLLPAQIILGHHGGLRDGFSGEKCFKSNLQQYPIKNYPLPDLSQPLAEAKSGVSALADLLQRQLQHITQEDKTKRAWAKAYAFMLTARMLYSCLVDADWLDTERFMNEVKYSQRGRYGDIAALWPRYQAHMAELSKGKKGRVNAARRSVNEDCQKMAAGQQGVYFLTVPTGGGKTLASLGFALEHAREHGLRRVIYVIPYTAIIKQTADDFRTALGHENVLEHYCGALDRADFNEDDSEKERKKPRLEWATENWDAPVIVTTAVQFFESLHGNKPSTCRKLHNIAKSVIVFDEYQTLPLQLLQLCQLAISGLVKGFGCTAVMCSATKSELGKQTWNGFGFEGAREIISDVDGLYKALGGRVTVEHLCEIGLDGLVKRLKAQKQAMIILNTKPQAAKLAKTLQEDIKGKVLHLSTNMCPAHRDDVLKEAKRRLKANEDVILVSTSLVEAGVDIDFPIVYRAMAGLDQLAQAAGRCNREGRLEAGLFCIFDLEGDNSLKEERQQRVQFSRETMEKFNDILSLEAMQYFSSRLFQRNLMGSLSEIILAEMATQESLQTKLFPYETVADKFVMIPDDSSVQIYCDYQGKAKDDFAALKNNPTWKVARKMGRWVASVSSYESKKLHAQELVEAIDDGNHFWRLASDKFYDPLIGVYADIELSPQDLMP